MHHIKHPHEAPKADNDSIAQVHSQQYLDFIAEHAVDQVMMGRVESVRSLSQCCQVTMPSGYRWTHASGVPSTEVLIAEGDMVQFNKRIKSRTADGFAMLSIKTKRKTTELLDQVLVLLEEK